MIGTYGPGGNVTYRADPNSPAGYSQYTQLDPGQQGIYDRGVQAQQGALQTANDQIGRINTALGRELTPPQMQGEFDPGGPVQTSFASGPGLRFGFDNGGPLTGSFNPGQGVQGSVGPTDFSADRNAVTDSEFNRARSRLDPMFQQAEDRERTRLANQGLSQNSSAYQTSMGNFDRSRNDAYDTALSSAVRAGSDQQQRLFDQSVAQGQFANQAAGQQYGQNQGLAAFANDVANQGYSRNVGEADFANQASGQQFAQNQAQAGFGNTAGAQQYQQNQGLANFRNAMRQQDFQNTAYSQNMPIEQFATLMGTGGGVAMPSAYNGPVAGVSPTDVLGSYGLYEQGRQSNYAQQVANVNSRNAAFANLAGAGLGMFNFGGGG